MDDIELARDGRVTYRNFRHFGFEKVTWGVYSHPVPLPDDVYEGRRARFLQHARCVIAAYGGEGAVLYGATALQVLGVALPDSVQDWDNCHLAVPGSSRPRRKDVIPHRLKQPTVWREIAGLPVMNPVDHWTQLRGATVDEIVEVGDGLVRRRHPLMTLPQVKRRLGELSGAPGVKDARRALRWVVPGTDSLYETRVRMVLVRAGLPVPSVNLPVAVESVGRVYHLDLGYEKERVGVEFDGLVHVANQSQMRLDAARRRDLQDAGWVIVTITADQLRNPQQFIGPIRRALVFQGWHRR